MSIRLLPATSVTRTPSTTVMLLLARSARRIARRALADRTGLAVTDMPAGSDFAAVASAYVLAFVRPIRGTRTLPLTVAPQGSSVQVIFTATVLASR